jgi:hypothetical protein
MRRMSSAKAFLLRAHSLARTLPPGVPRIGGESGQRRNHSGPSPTFGRWWGEDGCLHRRHGGTGERPIAGTSGARPTRAALSPAWSPVPQRHFRLARAAFARPVAARYAEQLRGDKVSDHRHRAPRVLTPPRLPGMMRAPYH